MAPLQVATAGTRVRTAPRCAKGVVIPVGLRVEHHFGPRIGVPIDPRGEVADPIRAPTRWNARQFAIVEIHRSVRGEILFRIPDGEFPGPWAPLPGDG